MSVNEIRDFFFENYYKRIRFYKKNSYYSMKRLERKDLLSLAKKYLIFLMLKNTMNHLQKRKTENQ